MTPQQKNTDPGPITHPWITNNKDRKWTETEKKQAKKYIERKKRMRKLGRSKQWMNNFKKSKQIVREKT